MKNLKSIICSAGLMLALHTGCENSLTSTGNINANEEKIQSDNTVSKIFYTVIKIAPGETVRFDKNLPFETFNNFIIKNISSRESNICSKILYSFNAPNFTGDVHECIIGGEEIMRLDDELFDLEIKNNSESVLKLEVTIFE